MTTPYRSPNEVAQAELLRHELVYVVRASEVTSAARSGIQIGLAGSVGAALAVSFGHPMLGLGVFLSSTAIGIVRWRRAPSTFDLVLRIDDRSLSIHGRAANRELFRAPLTKLRNVSLDSKSIRKVVPGQDATAALGFLQSNVGPEVDVARIVLSVEGSADLFRLTEAFHAHMEALEWTGKIRSFLRSHGWTPEDERE